MCHHDSPEQNAHSPPLGFEAPQIENMIGQGVYFALLSMLLAGVNDVVFKKYSNKERSRGMYILGIGATWALLQLLYVTASGANLAFDANTIKYGVTAGVLLAASNILLVESLTRVEVSVGSTIYRLNTVGVVALSIIFLQESAEAMKLAGILVGVLAILLLYRGDSSFSVLRTTRTFFLFAVLASLLRALYGVISKAGLLAAAEMQSIIMIAACCWMIGGAAYARYIENRFVLTRKKITYSVVSGLLVFGIVNCLMLGLDQGEASIVIPIANMSFVVAIFISGVMGLEKIDLSKGLATVCAVGSIVLLANV